MAPRGFVVDVRQSDVPLGQGFGGQKKFPKSLSL
jgi:hypothetical protein